MSLTKIWYNNQWVEVAGSGLTVVNNLTSTLTDAALSANQGKLLNDKFSNYLTSNSAANTYLTKSTADSTYKPKQTALTTINGTTNRWLSYVTQDANGVITENWASLDTSGTWSGNATTATTATNATNATNATTATTALTANKVEQALTITVGGVTKGAFDGSTARTIDVNAMDLNINAALQYIGRVNTIPTTASVTTTDGTTKTATAGSVVIYVGSDASMTYTENGTQTTVTVPSGSELLYDNSSQWYPLNLATSFSISPHIHGNIDSAGYLTDSDGAAQVNKFLVTNSSGLITAGQTLSELQLSVINLIYPVGSIYITGDSSFNPATNFGGTWTQLTGDQYLKIISGSDSQTGGSNTITTSNMPAHTHTFTGSAVTSGTQSANHTHTFTGSAVTSGNQSVNHTHSVGAHSHGLNSHTHSIPKLSGTAASAGAHTHTIERSGYGQYGVGGGSGWGNPLYSAYDWSTYWIWSGSMMAAENGAHTHSVTTTASTSGAASGSTANSSAFNTGVQSASHTHQVTAKGTLGNQSASHTHSVTASGTNSSTGSGAEFHPAYYGVYVWQRTA